MINSDKKVAKVAKEYYCECCDYKCSNKTNYEKHLTTAKHKKQQNMIKSDEIMINSDEKVAKVAKVANKEFVYIIKNNLKKNTPKYAIFVKYMINSDKKVEKVEKKYYCKICDYECCRKNNYNKHLSTVKHKKQQNMIKSDEIMINSDEKVEKGEKVENEKFVYILLKTT